jgi:hypothetical protein
MNANTNPIQSIVNNQVKPSQLRAILKRTIPERYPVLISGAPGIGKTDIVESTCQEIGAHCIVMHPVVSDPTDFKGMPFITEKGARFVPFDDLDELIDAKELTAVFLDDLGQASASVQAAAMQLILARKINRHKISDNVVFLAATNRRTDRAGVTGILEPVKSRFLTILELVTNYKEWRAWARTAGIHPIVIAFLGARPQFLSDFQPSADLTNSPCPRTWSSVSKTAYLDLPKQLSLPMYVGSVGSTAALEYSAYLNIWQNTVSHDLVLTTPSTAPIPKEVDSLYALMGALAMHVEAFRMPAYCEYLERLQREGRAEFAAMSLQDALARDGKLANTHAYITAMSGPLGQLMTGGECI